MDVSIILVNYNTKSLTLECVNSIVSKTNDLSYEIIVVDNDSTDGSKELLSKDQRIIFVESGTNGGFGKGNNIGVSVASGKYLFFLNTDTFLLNNAIKDLFDYCETHSNDNLGVVGSWLLKSDKTVTTSCAAYPSVWSTWKHLFRYFHINQDYTKSKYSNKKAVDIEVVTGADMFIRKDVFISVNGFDEDYFMYTDEVDLQYRIIKKGYINKIIQGPQIIHLEGSSSGSKNATKASFFVMYSMRRGRSLFYRKNKSLFQCFLVALLDFPVELILLLYDNRRFKNRRWEYLKLYKLLFPFFKIPPQIKDKSFYM